MNRKGKRGSAEAHAIVAVLAIGTFLYALQAAAQSNGDPATGKIVYKKNCAHCHGKTGEGLGPEGALPNFSDSAYMAKKKDEELLEKVTRGGRGTGMPSFGKILSDQDRKNVVAYVRTLSAPPTR